MDLHRVRDIKEAKLILSTRPGPQAILVTDEALISPATPDKDRENLVYEVKRYIQDGGRVILMGDFASIENPEPRNKLFAKLDSPWAVSILRSETLYTTQTPINVACGMGNPDYFMATRCSGSALYIKNVFARDAWYARANMVEAVSKCEVLGIWGMESNEADLKRARQEMRVETPVAMRPLGNGFLGYIGYIDVNGEALQGILFVMCGLIWKER